MTLQIVIAIALLVLIGIFLVACSSGTVIMALEAAVSAAEVAIPVVAGAVGLPPATLSTIMSYLQAVSEATSQASTILASTTTTSAQKSAAILQAFVTASKALNLPPGTSTEVVSVVNAVATAVANFLTNFANAKPVPVTAKPADITKLATLKARPETSIVTLKGYTKK
jgi:hypothetical protein